jgi:hypothetical protein
MLENPIPMGNINWKGDNEIVTIEELQIIFERINTVIKSSSYNIEKFTKATLAVTGAFSKFSHLAEELSEQESKFRLLNDILHGKVLYFNGYFGKLVRPGN